MWRIIFLVGSGITSFLFARHELKMQQDDTGLKHLPTDEPSDGGQDNTKAL